MDFDNLSKEDLMELLDKELNKSLKEKATLKELTTTHTLKGDTLFIIPNGFIIGKPFVDKEPFVSGYIILSDVIMIDSLYAPIKRSNFGNMCFQLAIDQIIAFSPIERETFLHQIESQQES